MENNEAVRGKGNATASLVLGILSVLFCFGIVTSVVSIILGIIGMACSDNAKKKGFTGGTRTAGLVLSIIGMSLGGLALLGFLFVSIIAA